MIQHQLHQPQHSDSYTAAQRCAIDLRGVPQIPGEIAEKLSKVERYRFVELSSSDYKRIRKAINAACAEIQKRRMELMCGEDVSEDDLSDLINTCEGNL